MLCFINKSKRKYCFYYFLLFIGSGRVNKKMIFFSLNLANPFSNVNVDIQSPEQKKMSKPYFFRLNGDQGRQTKNVTF